MAVKTETPFAGFENFTFAGNQAVKDQFDRTMSAFGEFNVFSKTNVDAVVESVTKAGEGVEQINSHVINYTKSQIEQNVAAARRFAGAKSVQELIEMHSDFAKTSLDAYLGEMNKLTDLCAGAMKDAVKPINERMSAAIELMQAQR